MKVERASGTLALFSSLLRIVGGRLVFGANAYLPPSAEWFDGSGYPAGLAGENIRLHARILAVADSYDAITTDRPYRKGIPKRRALEILKNRAGTQFDAAIVEVLQQLCASGQLP